MRMVGVARFKVSLQIYLCSLAGIPDTVCILVVVLEENPENRVGAEISDALLCGLAHGIPPSQRSFHAFNRLKES